MCASHAIKKRAKFAKDLARARRDVKCAGPLRQILRSIWSRSLRSRKISHTPGRFRVPSAEGRDITRGKWRAHFRMCSLQLCPENVRRFGKPRLRASRRSASGSSGTVCVCCSAFDLQSVFDAAQKTISAYPATRGFIARQEFEFCARAGNAFSVLVSWRNALRAPCTSCSACTTNSISRMPPAPSLTFRSRFS